jgi:hypothetical protein
MLVVLGTAFVPTLSAPWPSIEDPTEKASGPMVLRMASMVFDLTENRKRLAILTLLTFVAMC